MIRCNTLFGKLHDVIVGREFNIDYRSIDITFKHFFKESLSNGIYNSTHCGYRINKDILYTRILQLDNLANILVSLGVNVYRPNIVKCVKKIKTPIYNSESTVANNVRDLTLIYNNKIIETPICLRNRLFENQQLYKIFERFFDHGNNVLWIKAPITKLSNDTYDTLDWKSDRDYTNINPRFEMAIDAPNFLIIGRDVIINISTLSQYLGYEWIKSFFPESTFHIIKCCDNHIDGTLITLRPGVFLANLNFKQYLHLLPEKFKLWTFLYPDASIPYDVTGLTDINILLASSLGMDINVLSIDEKTVLVNKRAINVIKILESNKFNVIPIELDYGELFGGGIHCSTLDLIRDDEYIYYN